MAKLECTLQGDFDTILHDLMDTALNGSMSASLEEASDFQTGSSRCSVRVLERYSWSGGNRVSMSLTLFESEGRIWLSATTSGGSQGLFCKINTWGESAFLDTIADTINKYRI